MGVAPTTIKGACDGDTISTCGYYLRWWDPSIEIDVPGELGELNLQEYDNLLGVKRMVYKTHKMTRKSLKLKYNMKATPEKIKRLKRNETNKDTGCE